MTFLFGTSDTISSKRLEYPSLDTIFPCGAVLYPRGYKCGEVAIVAVEGYTMVAVPEVEDTFLFATGGRAYLMERTLRVVGFSGSVYVECLKVYYASGFAIFLGANHHAVAPSHWLADWYRFNDI